MTEPKTPHDSKPRSNGVNAIKTKDAAVAALFRESVMQGLTLDDLSEALGIARNTLSQWKAGRTFPNSANMANFAQVMGCRLKLEKIK